MGDNRAWFAAVIPTQLWSLSGWILLKIQALAFLEIGCHVCTTDELSSARGAGMVHERPWVWLLLSHLWEDYSITHSSFMLVCGKPCWRTECDWNAIAAVSPPQTAVLRAFLLWTWHFLMSVNYSSEKAKLLDPSEWGWVASGVRHCDLYDCHMQMGISTCGRSEHDEQSWLNTDTSGEGEYLQHFLLTLIVRFMLEWQEVEMK